MTRKRLLPPYLSDVAAFTDLIDALDTTWDTRIDAPKALLAKLRDTWIVPDSLSSKIEDGQMLAYSDFTELEREVLVKQANMIGFELLDASLVSDEDYKRITQNLSQYWYQKGTRKFVDFMGFVLNTVLSVKQLWSTPVSSPTGLQYGPFLPEGDPGIGLPLWQGGSWFPTTHIQVAFDPFKYEGVNIQKVVQLFYAIANYNLVVDSILMDGQVFIRSHDALEISNILVAYPMVEKDLLILEVEPV